MAKIDKRLTFLAEKYNVFMDSEMKDIITKLTEDGHEVTKVETASATMVGVDNDTVYAILDSVVTKTAEYEGEEVIKLKKNVSVHEDIFASMIAADPTENKIYLQWMLTVFTRLIKEGKIDDAIRFGAEDLPQANEFLELFENNKRKKLFSELCESNYALKGMSDPTNINQYKNLAQVFDAVDPFIERDLSGFERNMKRFVDAGQALIPVKDRNFTLFIPLTRDASVLFNDVASWCTVTPGNGMFSSYTSRPTPLSKKSKIYIIIDNKFLKGDYNTDEGIPNDMMYQIHFESKQLRDRSNGSNRNIYDNVISKSEALANFFYEELTPFAKASGTGKDNYYVDYLIGFGFTNILFDMLDVEQPVIRFTKREIPKLPDLSRFRNTSMIFLGEIKLRELNASIFTLPNLEILAVPKNGLTALPKEIGKCKRLVFLNIVGNKITDIPEELGQLDVAMGGNLHRVSVRKDEIGEKNYEKLKRLLPSALLTDNVD
jgi:hypothetical protein